MITNAASTIPCLLSAGFAGRSRLLTGVRARPSGVTRRKYHEHVRPEFVPPSGQATVHKRHRIGRPAGRPGVSGAVVSGFSGVHYN